jgi:hypothetical protein
MLQIYAKSARMQVLFAKTLDFVNNSAILLITSTLHAPIHWVFRTSFSNYPDNNNDRELKLWSKNSH